MTKSNFKLNEDSFAKFLDRVKTDPSILLFGQNYIDHDGKNPLLSGLRHIPEFKEMVGIASFKDCWDMAVAGDAKNRGQDGALCRKLYAAMHDATMELPDQTHLRKIIKLGWSIVFTSAADNVLSRKLGDNLGLSHIDIDKIEFRREYINPRKLHCAWLYGSLDPEESRQAPINEKELWAREGKAVGILSWIDQILNGYGVLAIDGWSPDDDWLNANSLASSLSGLPQDSVWLFGNPNQFNGHGRVQKLVEEGIVRLAGMTFEEALLEFGYLDEEEEEDHTYGDGVPVTIGAKGREKSRIALIPYDDYGALDSRIKLLTDDMELPPLISDYNRIKKFAHFLSQSGSPTWSFFHTDAGFYFHRDKEKELLELIASQIKSNPDGFSRRPILLAGPSNSGKTSLLAHIAMVLKKKHEFPVFFISGEPGSYNFGDSLKKMIKTYFMEAHGHKTKRNAIIIWDNASSLNDERRYIQLQRQLSECNPVIIGSCYSNDTEQGKRGTNSFRINLGSTLSQEEKNRLEKVLGNISQDYLRKFQAISRSRNNNANKKFNDYNIFYILEKTFEFEYGSEFQSVRKVLAERFQLETGIAEERANNQLDEFVKFYDEAEKSVLEKGFASTWQIQLEEWKKRNNMRPAEAADNCVRLERFEEMRASIEKINSLLAVAGQFGAELPLDLVLSFIRQSGGSSGDVHNKIRFILKTLEKDTLVQCQADETKAYFVRFRHPFEAQRYLSLHAADMQKEEKIKYETDLLMEMIKATGFGTSSFHLKESQNMLKLIRRFGPNSVGRFDDEKFTPGNYKRYHEHLVSIAECIIENAENDPEALLVAAHFLREAGEDKCNLDKAKGLLQKIIEDVDKESKQYRRVAVELCSNLVRGMELGYASEDESLNIVNQVRNYLTEVYKKRARAGISGSETNILLDIWLNCFVNYKNTKSGEFKKSEEYHELLVETLLKITAWLEVTYDLSKDKFLKNIQNVYAELKEPDDRLKKRLCDKNNDSYLYLEARGFWQRESSSDNPIERDAFLAPDMPERYPDFQLSEDFRKRIVEASERTVEFLEREENQDLVKKSAGKRCLKMLLRSKWISATRHLPFEEDQLISFTRSQWKEFFNLAKPCKETQDGYYLPALFIDAVYTWIFEDPKEGKKKFRVINDEFRWGWQKNPVILALPGNEKRLFKVRTYEGGDKRLLAEITDEISLSRDSDDYPSLKGWKGIYVSSTMLNYLYGNIQDRQPRQFSKTCTLNFNMSGPLLGMPGKSD